MQTMSFSLLCQCVRYFLFYSWLSGNDHGDDAHLYFCSLFSDILGLFITIALCTGVYAIILLLVQPMAYNASTVCKQGPLHAGLVDAIRPYLPALRNSPYGKRILSRTNIKK